MATVTELYAGKAPEGGVFKKVFGNLAERYARHQVFRQCVNELSSLSNRELGDLGMNRSMIRSVAYEQAYGPRAA